MIPYKNLAGDSNVLAYETGPDWILVRFRRGPAFKYTVESAGAENIQTMKELAERGLGLNAFINTHVRYRHVPQGT